MCLRKCWRSMAEEDVGVVERSGDVGRPSQGVFSDLTIKAYILNLLQAQPCFLPSNVEEDLDRGSSGFSVNGESFAMMMCDHELSFLAPASCNFCRSSGADTSFGSMG